MSYSSGLVIYCKEFVDSNIWDQLLRYGFEIIFFSESFTSDGFKMITLRHPKSKEGSLFAVSASPKSNDIREVVTLNQDYGLNEFTLKSFMANVNTISFYLQGMVYRRFDRRRWRFAHCIPNGSSFAGFALPSVVKEVRPIGPLTHGRR